MQQQQQPMKLFADQESPGKGRRVNDCCRAA